MWLKEIEVLDQLHIINIISTRQVYNLESGHEYEFRVRAKNAAGFSRYSANSTKYPVKSKCTVPSPPGQPKVLKVGRNYVDLKWEVPANDGGEFWSKSNISSLFIESNQKGKKSRPGEPCRKRVEVVVVYYCSKWQYSCVWSKF